MKKPPVHSINILNELEAEYPRFFFPLTVYCTSDTLELFREHPDVILLNEYKGYTIIGNVNLLAHPLNNSRGNNCVIAVNLLNIGRGEALNIEIKTTVRGNNDITPQIGNTSYPQINLSQGLLLISIVDSEVVKKWELPVIEYYVIRRPLNPLK